MGAGQPTQTINLTINAQGSYFDDLTITDFAKMLKKKLAEV